MGMQARTGTRAHGRTNTPTHAVTHAHARIVGCADCARCGRMVDGDGEATGGVEATGLVVEVAVDPVELGTTSEHGSSSSADRMLRSQERGVFSLSIIFF